MWVKQGLVRLGCACYTTDDEVARVIEGIDRAVIPSGSEVKVAREQRRSLSLLRELGMRVQRVEVLVPDRVVEAVERHRTWLRFAIDVAGDALRPVAGPAGILAVRRDRVEVVAPVPPIEKAARLRRQDGHRRDRRFHH